MGLDQKALVSLVALVVGLSGCVSQGPAPSGTVLDRYAPQAVATVARLEIPVTAEDFELSAQDRANMSAFAAQYRGLGRGPLVVSMPTGGSNSQSAVTLAAQARTQMHAEGVPFEAITGGAYDASGRAAAPIIVSFRRFQAVVPDCGPPTENLARNPTNQPPANFGCALNASIAAQIADPGDIAAPHPTDPADTLRRQAVLDNYRGGARTSAAEGANATLSTTNAGQ